MNTNSIFIFAFGIGVVAGLRSMTAPAAISWAVYFGWLGLRDSPLAFMGSIAAVVVFSLLALGEWVADLLPTTPRRTALVPLATRILTGGLCGACLCASANQSMWQGALFGGIGGIAGAFSGYEIRRRLVTAFNIKDLFIALTEDLAAIALAWLFVSR